MFSRSDKRFQDANFQAKQDASRRRREMLLPVLGLKEGQEEWFELPEKKSATEFNVQSLRDIEGLSVVSPIFLEDVPTPAEVLAKAHGTIIWKNKFILRKSTPYQPEIRMDELPLTEDGTLSFDLPLNMFEADPEECSFREYVQGTLFDIMFINGSIQYFTQRNLIPAGVKAPTTVSGMACQPGSSEWLHQPGRWGAANTSPFETTFRKIATIIDPTWLDSAKLYPKGCKFSPIMYRFVIATRHLTRAGTRQVGPLGYLVYLGHSQEWTKADWLSEMSAEELGTWHEEKDIYKPVYRTSPPEDLDAPYIMQQPEDIGLEEARKILAGNYQNLMASKMVSETDALRFSGGGKLIVTAKYLLGRRTFARTFHISSSAWLFRERMMGNDSNLYKHFTTLMSTKEFDAKNLYFAEHFAELYSIIQTPVTNQELAQVNAAVKAKKPLLIKSETADYLAELEKDGKIQRAIWYSFLCCSNISIREIVYRYFFRYVKSLDAVAEWLTKTDNFRKREMPESQRNKIEAIVAMAKRKPDYKDDPKRRLMLTLQKTGDKGAYVINSVIKLAGLQKDMILISEPTATFYEEQTYASVCRNTKTDSD